MGGLGSGNRWRYGTKTTTDDCLAIDIRRWALTRLAALNRARSEAEMRGEVLWLRPEFQTSVVRKAKAAQLDLAAPEAKRQRSSWPAELSEQVLSVRRVLAAEAQPLNVADVAKRYQRAPKARIESTLATLATLGHARALGDGRFAALR